MGLTINKMLANSHAHGGTRVLSSVKYIVIHYTGGNGDTAKNEATYFANSNTRSAGAHYFVGQDGTVYLSVELNVTAWSVGGSKYSNTGTTGGGAYYGTCTNANSVSIELCDNATKDPSAKQIEATRLLVQHIQSQCPNAKTIIRHFDVTGKDCPARMAPDNASNKTECNNRWNDFKKKITSGTGSNSSSTVTSSKPDTSKAKVVNYKGTVNATSLNVRQYPGTSYSIVGSLTKGTSVTVSKELNGWGYISAKKGWVSLDYIKKIATSSSTKTTTTNNSTSYKVKITATTLNVRNGAGTSYKINTTVKKGDVYTIVEEKSGWGKLKSGAGWISLQYTQKV